ncbi:hypothetical protein OFN37_24985, partial [Escherichia coli]|nr:hypothetical protein [Escherichia coli]
FHKPLLSFRKKLALPFIFYKHLLLPFFVLAASRSEQATCTFYNPVPAARMFGGFTSSYEAKSASTSEAPSPPILNEPLLLLNCI